MNDYLNDAIDFLTKVPKRVGESMNKDEVLDGTLFWALGVERLLKGILYNLNPAFIYKVVSFENLVPILYKDRIVQLGNEDSKLKKEPNGDVITFRRSIEFAKEISKTTNEYKGRLFFLNNNRDILAHCNLNLISMKKAKESLQRDFYPMITSFCDELNIDSRNIFQEYEDNLHLLSIRLQEDKKKRIAELIEFHKNKWVENQKNEELSKWISNEMMVYKQENSYDELIECPICGNDAILDIEPDFDVEGSECIYYGLSIGLVCKYCGLTIDDPEDLDYFDINEGTLFS